MRNTNKKAADTQLKKIKKLKLTPAQLAKMERFADCQGLNVKEVIAKPTAELKEILRFKISESKHWRVRCVDDSGMDWPHWRHPKGHIKKGQIYHVTGPNRYGDGYVILGKPAIRISTGREVGWNTARFVVL